MAVSCDVNENNDHMCNRYIFSSSCDSSTIQDRNGWTYNILDSVKITRKADENGGKYIFCSGYSNLLNKNLILINDNYLLNTNLNSHT